MLTGHDQGSDGWTDLALRKIGKKRQLKPICMAGRAGNKMEMTRVRSGAAGPPRHQYCFDLQCDCHIVHANVCAFICILTGTFCLRMSVSRSSRARDFITL